jgi:two-component system sensor histidine kinase BaeS
VQAFTISPFILLLDAERNIIEGPPNATMPPELKPVVVNGDVVGYLGFARRSELSRTIDQLFAAEQKRSVLLLTLLLLATAVILAAGIAHFLARPIRRLRTGTNALIDGRYDARVTISGGDELAQLAQHFNRLGETLSANRDAQRQWIADIAHELRTPLAVLQGEIEAMHDGIRVASPQRIASLLQETQRLTRLVEDLHTLSLSDVGGLRYTMEALDLGELVADALETHRLSLHDATIATTTDIRGPNPVHGDPVRLDQLITNLVQNTTRYTDRPGKLEVGVHNDGGDVVFDWMDSSPGVRDEELPLLTDRLYRVARSRDAASGGTGLGLAIVRTIVEAHDGTIAARHSPLGGVWLQMRFRRRRKE